MKKKMVMAAALMMSGSMALGAYAADTEAGTFSVHDIVLEVGGTTYQIGPKMFISGSASDDGALLQGGVELDGETLMPAGIKLDDNGLSIALGSNGNAYHISMDMLESADEDFDSESLDALLGQFDDEEEMDISKGEELFEECLTLAKDNAREVKELEPVEEGDDLQIVQMTYGYAELADLYEAFDASDAGILGANADWSTALADMHAGEEYEGMADYLRSLAEEDADKTFTLQMSQAPVTEDGYYFDLGLDTDEISLFGAQKGDENGVENTFLIMVPATEETEALAVNFSLIYDAAANAENTFNHTFELTLDYGEEHFGLSGAVDMVDEEIADMFEGREVTEVTLEALQAEDSEVLEAIYEDGMSTLFEGFYLLSDEGIAAILEDITSLVESVEVETEE